ncbi:MAG: MalY/PatB family protein [Succinivibrio sp.]
MGKYNFDEEIERRNTLSLKWDLIKDPEVLPLWVADMDFKAAPAIYEEVTRLASQGVYGYSLVPDEYYQAICDFHKRHYNSVVKKEWIIPTPAVVPALTAVLQALTQCGDEVILQTPAYNCFFSCIKNSGLVTVENKILYKNGKFLLNFDELEKQASSPKARILLLCNPQNPTGRLWTKEELLKILEICQKHNLYVISDEVHCDLHPKGTVFTSFCNLSSEFNQRLITLRSASKTFNIAGIKNAYIICENKELRYKIDRQVNINEICDVDTFGTAATIAAYTKCDDWMEELNDYIQSNYEVLKKFFKENYPDVKVAELESTYLAWVDMSCFKLTSEQIRKRLLEKSQLLVNDGEMYHSPHEGFIRINLGCTRSNLEKALERIKKAF